MNPEVDFFFREKSKWQKEYEILREIVLSCGLAEELKWGCPCYTINRKNVVLIHGFKEYCALLFHKGALLSDPENILIQQTENVQAARQIRFTHFREIEEMKPVLKSYIFEAAEVEKSGLKVIPKKTSEFTVPEEFREKLEENAALESAFKALTPGRQRGYLLHFSGAKQSKTRLRRIEKNIPNILNGKGLNDKF